MVSSHAVIGIDLGTTNSAVAVIEGDEPGIIANAEGDRTTPSVVAFSDDGERLVGKPAKNQAVRNPDRTVQSIKRHMGEDHTVEIDDEEYTPEEISATILRKIKHDAEEYLGKKVERAVITVPTHFDNKQRQATKDAGETAGFDVERIVNESTAASMAYGLDDESDRTVLVYDLGGGTFSVSVIDVGGGVYEVVATNGDNDLGGDDWDEALIDHMAEMFEDDHGIDLREDREALQRLKNAAEVAKIELSNKKETTVNLPYITVTDADPVHLEQSITRATFESLTEDLIERTIGPTEQAIADANYAKSDIDEVILVGGSTRMPQAQEKVEELVGQEPKKNVNSDEAVALGAAVQGGVLSGDITDIVLLPVTPLSLGIAVQDGSFERLIERNTTVPTTESKVFTTAADDQTSVNVRVFQGEHDTAQENELLGAFQITNIPSDPDWTPQIGVTLNIDEDASVIVEVRDHNADDLGPISIERVIGFSGEDSVRVGGGAKYADEASCEQVNARGEAKTAVRRAEALLEENEGKVDDDLVADIEDAVEKVEDALGTESTPTEEITTATEILGQKLQDLGERVYLEGSTDSDPREQTRVWVEEQADGAFRDMLAEQILTTRNDLNRGYQYCQTSDGSAVDVDETARLARNRLEDHLVEPPDGFAVSAYEVGDEISTLHETIVDSYEEVYGGDLTVRDLEAQISHFDDALSLYEAIVDSYEELHGGDLTVQDLEAQISHLDDALSAAGYTVIDPERDNTIDPHRHRVISTVESTVPEGQIVRVEEAGYERNGEVMREATVVVSEGQSLVPESVPTPPRCSATYDRLDRGDPIGRGGKADVYRAILEVNSEPVEVAVKEPHVNGTLHTEAVDRMVQEAETWQRLDAHDHIVSVIDYGAEPLPWIAMEYMDAGHLGERAGELDIDQALWSALAITKAVRHAHRLGVAHLDLKPENVLFRSVEGAWDVPKVADWGLSKQLLQHSKSVEGMSPHYAAPEQFDDELGPTDDITDIYQLGSVLYELLTGRPPFEGRPDAVLNEEPSPPSEVADVPTELDRILLQTLETERENRYETVIYLRDDLQSLWESLSASPHE